MRSVTAVVLRVSRGELDQWRTAARRERKPLSRWCRETMNAALRGSDAIPEDDTPPVERRLFVQIYCSLVDRDAWREAATRHALTVSSLCRRLLSQRAAKQCSGED